MRFDFYLEQLYVSMINKDNILETIRMIQDEKLDSAHHDGISLFDCADSMETRPKKNP